MSVAQDQGDPDRDRDQPPGPADVEDLALATQDRGNDLRITGQPPDRGGRQVGAVAGHPHPHPEPEPEPERAGDRACDWAGDRGVCEPLTQGLEIHGEGEPGGGAVGLRWQVGVQAVSGQADQGVPHPGPVVARVVDQVPVFVAVFVAVFVVDGRGRGRQRQEGGGEEGAVLGGASALQTDPARAVGGDGQEPVVVGGAFLARQLSLQLPVGGVGVDHVHQVPPGPGQLTGVQRPGVVEQGPFAAGPDRLPRRQRCDGGHDHLGLLR
jgi:hypothetical protein